MSGPLAASTEGLLLLDEKTLKITCPGGGAMSETPPKEMTFMENNEAITTAETEKKVWTAPELTKLSVCLGTAATVTGALTDGTTVT